jgi:exodeoxyribonuclease VII large subunit
LSVLKRRFPAIPVVIYPVAVQGDNAKFEISAALHAANHRAEADVIILARGGGSLEDLWAFNEEIVARAIAASKIPVISGVGHEVDVSIADFVADLRAATPSAAAEHAVPLQLEWLHAFEGQEQRLIQILHRMLSHQQQRLNWFSKGLQTQHPGQKLQRNAQRLDELEQRLTQAIQHRLRDSSQQLQLSRQSLLQHQPGSQIARHRLALSYFQQRLETAIRHKLQGLKQQQASISQTLHAVSPLATLDRGYAIVQRGDHTVVKSTQQIAIGDSLNIRVAQGEITAEVKKLGHVAPIDANAL